MDFGLKKLNFFLKILSFHSKQKIFIRNLNFSLKIRNFKWKNTNYCQKLPKVGIFLHKSSVILAKNCQFLLTNKNRTNLIQTQPLPFPLHTFIMSIEKSIFVFVRKKNRLAFNKNVFCHASSGVSLWLIGFISLFIFFCCCGMWIYWKVQANRLRCRKHHVCSLKRFMVARNTENKQQIEIYLFQSENVSIYKTPHLITYVYKWKEEDEQNGAINFSILPRIKSCTLERKCKASTKISKPVHSFFHS